MKTEYVIIIKYNVFSFYYQPNVNIRQKDV